MQLFTEDKNIINKYLQTLVSIDIIFILIKCKIKLTFFKREMNVLEHQIMN